MSIFVCYLCAGPVVAVRDVPALPAGASPPHCRPARHLKLTLPGTDTTIQFISINQSHPYHTCSVLDTSYEVVFFRFRILLFR